MRKFLGIFLLIAAICSMAACVPTTLSTGGGQTSTSLGPDSPTTGETTEAVTKSTLSDRITAGCSWLWSSYGALKGRVDPAIEPMRRLYVAAQEMATAAHAGDLFKALALYSTARGLVTEIAGGGK